jgi:plasmid stability protein
MAQVLIRDIAPETVDKLKARARRNRRSLEAELRVIFEKAVEEPEVEKPEVDSLAEVERVRALFAGRTFERRREMVSAGNSRRPGATTADGQ